MAFATRPRDSGCPHPPIHPMTAECPTIFSVVLIMGLPLAEKMLQSRWAEEGSNSNAPIDKGSLPSQVDPEAPPLAALR